MSVEPQVRYEVQDENIQFNPPISEGAAETKEKKKYSRCQRFKIQQTAWGKFVSMNPIAFSLLLSLVFAILVFINFGIHEWMEIKEILSFHNTSNRLEMATTMTVFSIVLILVCSSILCCGYFRKCPPLLATEEGKAVSGETLLFCGYTGYCEWITEYPAIVNANLGLYSPSGTSSTGEPTSNTSNTDVLSTGSKSTSASEPKPSTSGAGEVKDDVHKRAMKHAALSKKASV